MDNGIFIPNEILDIEELSFTEKGVLAQYKYYTEQGKNKCCSLTKPQIADKLGISVVYMKKIKQHLKELGLIKSSGIKVFYVGIKGDTTVSPNNKQGDTIVSTNEPTNEQGDTRVSTGGYQSIQGGIPEYPQGDTIVSTKGIAEYPHKKEKKEKKEEKRKNRGEENLTLLFSKLPSDYNTPERVEYIKKNYMDRLDEADFNESGVLETYITGIKVKLNEAFPINFVIPKQEKKSDFIDVI